MAKCDCSTKTPDPGWHEHTCPVWLEWRVLELETRMVKNFVVRRETDLDECQVIINTLHAAIEKRLKRHGFGVAAGPHEIYGILAEEMDELLDEVRSNNHRQLYEELVDISIGAIFGMISMKKRIDFEALQT